MRAPLCGAACALLLATVPMPVRADGRGKDIVIEVPGERTLTTRLVIGGLAGAGVVAGALGLYFHLDSRSAANAESADAMTGRAWTQEDVDQVDRASSSRTKAAVGYSIGGALLIGAVVALIATDPGSETAVIHPHTGVATIVPTAGGAVVGGVWSF